MKKLYFMLMSMVAVLSTSFFCFKAVAHDYPDTDVIGIKYMPVPLDIRPVENIESPVVIPGQNRIPTIDEIAGEWQWVAVNVLADKDDEEKGVERHIINIRITDREANKIVIDDLVVDGLTLDGVFDPKTGDIVIENRVNLNDFNGWPDSEFCLFTVKTDRRYQNITSVTPNYDDPLVLHYDAEDGSYFNYMNYYGIQSSDKGLGLSPFDGLKKFYWQAYLFTTDTDEPADLVDDDDDYADAGMVEFVDGWLFGGFGFDQRQYPYMVELQANTRWPGVYRMVNPYSASGNHHLCSNYGINHSDEKGYIRINIANARLPYIYPNVYSGFCEEDLGRMYMYDRTGYIVEYLRQGRDYDYIANKYGDAQLSKIDEVTGMMIIPCACFGMEGDKFGCYTWQDNYGRTLDMTSTIMFPFNPNGIIDIEYTADDAYEFYNLQGMPVSPDTHGVLIVRHAGRTTKVIR